MDSILLRLLPPPLLFPQSQLLPHCLLWLWPFYGSVFGVGIDVIVTAVAHFKDLLRIEGWIDDRVSFFMHNFFD